MDYEDSYVTELEEASVYRSQDMLNQLRREVDRRLERFSARSLQSLGEKLGARRLILGIEDGDREVIHARLTRNDGGWDFAVDDSFRFCSRAASRRNRKPTFVLRSRFNYQLTLPHRWSGTLLIEYPGITFLSSEKDSTIRHELMEFSREVTILLMDRNLARLESCLNEEKKLTETLRAFVASLSKELYCLSSISIAMRQSYNVEAVLTKVLEKTLPILKAKLGVIYFPETGQCVTFHSSRSTLGRMEAPWFRDYFRSKMRLLCESSEGSWLSCRSVNGHPDFPGELKDHLSRERVESVMEFSLRYHDDFLGLGLLGLQQNEDRPAGTRLLMIVLNMIGLFLEHITLMTDLERQVKLISRQKLDMEKKQRFLIDHVGGERGKDRVKRSPTMDHLIEEIERSRNMMLLAELASGVAHQIRNPLGNLVYGLHLLRQPNITENEKNELIETVTERVETINRMINEFINYTRIPDLKFSRESINDVLKGTLDSFNGWFQLADIDLSASLDADLGATKMDSFLMSQTFHNIIKNSLEAMHSCGSLRVLTRRLKMRHCPDPQEFAEIVFEDSGPGVAEENIDKIMKPFYSKKDGGLGLGLALVDHIVRAHGGALTVENCSEGGLRTRIYLPMR
ncbi:MAG: ATP-binding protein [Desulfomonilaceae bacterium]|nr:ATP-binding protein [Desulfomonilaceae bacterium]